MLRRPRAETDAHTDKFRSAGFTRLFAMLRVELGDDYLANVDAHLARLKFHRGVLISGRLGRGNVGIDASITQFGEGSGAAFVALVEAERVTGRGLAQQAKWPGPFLVGSAQQIIGRCTSTGRRSAMTSWPTARASA